MHTEQRSWLSCVCAIESDAWDRLNPLVNVCEIYY
jgi:hypothetical protein